MNTTLPVVVREVGLRDGLQSIARILPTVLPADRAMGYFSNDLTRHAQLVKKAGVEAQ